MRLTHLKSIHAPVPAIAKVGAVCWSSDGRRLAFVTADRVVHLCDERGERRDKFLTKHADPAEPYEYAVKGIAWSPDASRLAVAQSDGIQPISPICRTPLFGYLTLLFAWSPDASRMAVAQSDGLCFISPNRTHFSHMSHATFFPYLTFLFLLCRYCLCVQARK